MDAGADRTVRIFGPFSRATSLVARADCYPALLCEQNLADLWWRAQVWYLPWIIAFTFGPVFSAIVLTGQISPGSYWEWWDSRYANDPRKGWLAGAFAVLATIKPQVTYLFLIDLWISVIVRRRWSIGLGFCIPLAAAALAALSFNPRVIFQYIHLICYHAPAEWASPTLGMILRFLFGPDQFWPQFLPVALGLAWYLWHRRRRNKEPDWQSEVPILIFASMITAAYAWTYDQVLLLIPVLQAFCLVTTLKRPNNARLLIVIYILIDVPAVLLHLRLNDFWFFWLAPCLLLWYLASLRADRIPPATKRWKFIASWIQ